MNNYCYVYCKFADEKRFVAYDIGAGVPAGKLIYATICMNTLETQRKLNELAILNKENGLQIQLRRNGKVVFQTM